MSFGYYSHTDNFQNSQWEQLARVGSQVLLEHHGGSLTGFEIQGGSSPITSGLCLLRSMGQAGAENQLGGR